MGLGGKMKTIDLQPDEYLGEDGLAYCKNCHTPRVYRIEDNFFHIPCKCRQEAYEKAEYERNYRSGKPRLKNTAVTARWESILGTAHLKRL